MGEKEYQMKVLFYMCSIPEWENLELYNKEKQKGFNRLQKKGRKKKIQHIDIHNKISELIAKYF